MHLIVQAFEHLLRHEEWNIGIVPEPIERFLRPREEIPVYWFPRLKQDGYLADPFAVVSDEGICILCEEYDYETQRGRIVSVKLNHEYVPSKPEPAIDIPSHASYPFLVHDDGEIYCVPETARAGEVSLYRAEVFPSKWSKISTLIRNFAASDPTIIHHEGKWWLICSGEDPLGKLANLFVWYAPKLLGPWKPHPRNPVKRDVRSSRAAGTPFFWDRKLYRPAQDCSETYGGRIVINEIKLLTDSEFQEEQVAVIEPSKYSPYPAGIHTLSAGGGVTLIDGKRLGLNRFALKRAILRTSRKLGRLPFVIGRGPDPSLEPP